MVQSARIRQRSARWRGIRFSRGRILTLQVPIWRGEMADQAPEIKVKLTAEDTGVAAAIKSLGDRLSELKTQSKDTSASFVNLKSAFDSLIASAVVYKIVEFGKEVFTASLTVDPMPQQTAA